MDDRVIVAADVIRHVGRGLRHLHFDAMHGFTRKEAPNERDTRIGGVVREGAVHALAVLHYYIAAFAEQGHGVGQIGRPPVRRHARLDVHAAVAMGTGERPQGICGSGVAELRHAVHSVRERMPVGAVPVGGAVLMPGHGSAQARLLQEDGVVVGHEVRSAHGRCDAQHVRMRGQAQRRRHGLEQAEHEEDGGGRRRRPGFRFVHAHRMAAVQQLGPAPGIGKRLRPQQLRQLRVGIEGAALAVHHSVLVAGRAREQRVEVGIELYQLCFVHDACEDVVARILDRFADIGGQATVRIEAQRPTITQRPRPLRSGLEIVRLLGRHGGPPPRIPDLSRSSCACGRERQTLLPGSRPGPVSANASANAHTG